LTRANHDKDINLNAAKCVDKINTFSETLFCAVERNNFPPNISSLINQTQ